VKKSSVGSRVDTGEAPDEERDDETMAINIAIENHISPRHMVPIQLNIFYPVGTAIKRLIAEKNGNKTTPVVNMWCAQTPGTTRRSRAWQRHALVPEDGLAREHGDDLGRHAEER